MKIYTKTGDRGTTSLVGGTRVSKCSLRVSSYGEVDELIACLGVLRAQVLDASWNAFLLEVQKDLMAACAYLAADEKGMKRLSPLDETLVTRLEAEIDQMQTSLSPQKYFIVPGASLVSAQANLARSVCRRAERKVLELVESGETLSSFIPIMLNRLSDYLYILSRSLTQFEQASESYWVPSTKDL